MWEYSVLSKITIKQHRKQTNKTKHNRAIIADSHLSWGRPASLLLTIHITLNYMTYFRLQASSRLCLAFQLAADLRVLIPSAGHVWVEVGACLEKGFFAFSL